MMVRQTTSINRKPFWRAAERKRICFRYVGLALMPGLAACSNCAHYGPDAAACNDDRRILNLVTSIAELPVVTVAGAHAFDRAASRSAQPNQPAPLNEPALTYSAPGSKVVLRSLDLYGKIIPFGPGFFAILSGGGLQYPTARLNIFDAAQQTQRSIGPLLTNFYDPLAISNEAVVGYDEHSNVIAIRANGTVTRSPGTESGCNVLRTSPSGKFVLCGDKTGLQSFKALSNSPISHLRWNYGEHTVDYAVGDDGTVVTISARDTVPIFSTPAFGKAGPRIKAAAVALPTGPDGRLRLAAIALTQNGTAARAVVYDAANGKLLFEESLGPYADGTVLVAPTGRIAFVSRVLLVIDPEEAGYKVIARLSEPSMYYGRNMAWDASGAWLLFAPLGHRAQLLKHQRA